MRKKALPTIFILLCLLIGVMILSLCCGQIAIALNDMGAIILKHLGFLRSAKGSFTQEEDAVMWFIRMPRTIIGALVGAALAISGTVMQGVFGNPLADPGLIGVSAGAATGAVLSIALGATSLFSMPLFAFLGALGAIAITVLLAMKHGKIPVMTLLLAGVAVGILLNALTSGVLTIMNEHKMQQYLFWMIGGLDFRRWEHVYIAVGPILIGGIVMVLLGRHLNILVLGENEAKAVGMKVVPFRLCLLLVASIITATAVCVSGNIGFVGLVIPHMMRMIVGPDHRVLIPASALAGAMFLVVCDTLGRVILPTTEIRVGIMTALLGTPYFLYLLRNMKKIT